MSNTAVMINEIQVKSVLNKKKKRDSWFLDEYTVNAYEGCSMNCLYCYVRGSKYGENMAERLSVKINAPEILEKQLQLRAKKNQFGYIVLASATDPYMPVDAQYGMTRKFLELFLKYRFPVHVITKSDLILNDIDLLLEIDKRAILPEDLRMKPGRGVIISFSIASLAEPITQILEPGAIPPVKRLETMQQLSEKSLLTGLNCMPVLPFISDSDEDLEQMIAAAKKYQAAYVLVAGLTLFGTDPGTSQVMYYKYLERFHPHLVEQYKKLYRFYPHPPYDYHNRINHTVKRLCEKYQIRNSIG